MPSPNPRSEGHVSCLPAGARPGPSYPQPQWPHRAALTSGEWVLEPEDAGLTQRVSLCLPVTVVPPLSGENARLPTGGCRGAGQGGLELPGGRERASWRDTPHWSGRGGPLSATVMRICSGPMTHAGPGSLLGRAPVMVSLSFSCLFSEMLSDLVVVTPPCTLSHGS